jgi:hypothetical protein
MPAAFPTKNSKLKIQNYPKRRKFALALSLSVNQNKVCRKKT